MEGGPGEGRPGVDAAGPQVPPEVKRDVARSSDGEPAGVQRPSQGVGVPVDLPDLPRRLGIHHRGRVGLAMCVRADTGFDQFCGHAHVLPAPPLGRKGSQSGAEMAGRWEARQS